ncbi:MAG: CopG family ribbon-helix-helix protein [Acidimicrobiia bacterium]
MGETARVNATMDAELLARLDAFAARRFEDRSTAIRQLLDFALRELAKRDALEAYRAGRLTLRELGRALGLEPWATADLLNAEGVAAAQGSREETAAAMRSLIESPAPARSRRRRSS